MAMSDERAIPDRSAGAQPPIEYLTENGFSIIRLCEIDKSISATGTNHQFLVLDPVHTGSLAQNDTWQPTCGRTTTTRPMGSSP